MMGSSRAIAALLASVLFASPVLGQPKPPTDQQKQQAGDLVKKAIARSQAGDHAGAIELYLQAYQVIPAALLLSNIGSEYQQSQKPVEALKYFCKYLESDPTGTSADFATAQAKVLQIQLGNKDVDDKAVCKPPEPPPAPKPVEPPPPPVAVETPHRSNLEYAGIASGAVGVVSLALGIYFGYKAQQASDLVTNWPMGMPWPADIIQQMKDGQSEQDKQIAFLVIGGVAVVTGGVLYYLGHKRSAEPTERTVLVPVVSPGGAGLGLAGRF